MNCFFNEVKPSWMAISSFTEWNICYITRMIKHSLLVLYKLYKDSNFYINSKEKVLKKTWFTQAKH